MAKASEGVKDLNILVSQSHLYILSHLRPILYSLTCFLCMYWLAIILFIVCVEHGVKGKDISFLVLEKRVKGTSTMWQKAKQCCSALSWRQHYSHDLPGAFCLSFFSGAVIKSSDLRKHKAGRLYFNLEFQATARHFKKVTNVRAWDSWSHRITVKNREKRDYFL